MFTGIVKEMGKVIDIAHREKAEHITIESSFIAETASIGDSISVNGVCLTVTDKKKSFIGFDAVKETFRKTNLGSLRAGSVVNLEEALKTGDRLGGHFVLGHVDTTGRIAGVRKEGDETYFDIDIPEGLDEFVVEKGSIAIDGISLTVSDISRSRFRVYVIPHTLSATTLGSKTKGESVNIEFDLLGKYILKSKGRPAKPITDSFLKEQGFM